MTITKSCCFVQDKNMNIYKKTATTKIGLRFSDISDGQAVLLPGDLMKNLIAGTLIQIV